MADITSVELSQRDLDLYRLDGRQFTISEEDQVLSLSLRRSAGWERLLLACMVGFFGLLYFLCGSITWVRWLRPVDELTKFVAQQLVILPFLYCVVRALVLIGMRKEAWIIDRSEKVVTFSGYHTLKMPFEDIQGVEAKRTRHNYRIYLNSKKYGKLQIGRCGFSIKERAWRDDAERIGAFLELPVVMN